MDGFNTSLLLGWPIFRGELLVSGRVHLGKSFGYMWLAGRWPVGCSCVELKEIVPVDFSRPLRWDVDPTNAAEQRPKMQKPLVPFCLFKMVNHHFKPPIWVNIFFNFSNPPWRTSKSKCRVHGLMGVFNLLFWGMLPMTSPEMMHRFVTQKSCMLHYWWWRCMVVQCFFPLKIWP